MPGKAAVVLTAAALSVTVGVLVGIVLIIGSRARQSSTTAGPHTSSGSVSAVSGAPPDSGPVQLSVQDASDPAGFSAPETTSPVAVLPAAASTAPRPTTPRPAARRPATTRSTSVRPSTTRPAIVFTTVTIAPPTSRSADPTTAPTSARVSTPTPTTPSGTTTAPHTSPPNGAPAAGQPCPRLGDKATAAGGNTLYCQTNFANGSLAWRAVVDGGGCLSKKMTGIGTDGRAYACRPDRKGLDFWRRA